MGGSSPTNLMGLQNDLKFSISSVIKSQNCFEDNDILHATGPSFSTNLQQAISWKENQEPVSHLWGGGGELDYHVEDFEFGVEGFIDSCANFLFQARKEPRITATMSWDSIADMIQASQKLHPLSPEHFFLDLGCYSINFSVVTTYLIVARLSDELLQSRSQGFAFISPEERANPRL